MSRPPHFKLRLLAVAACAVLLPRPAAAQPPLLAAVASAAAVAAGASTIIQTILFVSQLVYGAYKAHEARNDARRAYNRSLTDRTVTVMSADNPWQVLYGEAVVAPAVAAVLTSGERDEFKHVVTMWAAHECDSCLDALIAGESIGPLDEDGWVTTGKWAKASTPVEGQTVTLSGAGAATLARVPTAVVDIQFDAGGDNGFSNLPGSAVTIAGSTITVAPEYVATWAGRTVLVSYTWDKVTPRVRVRHFTGGADQLADPVLMDLLPDDWKSTDRLRGIAYSVWTFDLNEPELQNFPQLGARWRGKKVYDYRTSTTAWSANNALCTADFLRAEYGKRCTLAQLSVPSIIAAANACDETLPEFEDAPRYTCNGAFRTDQDTDVTLRQLLQSMAGHATFGGVWRLQAGVYTAPVMDLTDADNAGSVESIAAPPDIEVFNGVRGRFFDPQKFDQLTDYTPYANSAFVAEDGEALWGDLNLPFTAEAWRAHNIARIVVERSRGEQLVYPAKLRALRLKPGQRVTLTNSYLGFTAGIYRVVKKEWRPGTPAVQLHLQQDDPTYWDTVDAPASLPPPADNNPDPFVVAPVDALAYAGGEALAVRTAEGQVVVQVRLSFDASDDTLVRSGGAVQVEYRLPEEATWTRAPEGPGAATDFTLQGLLAARSYLVQARWRNSIGSVSDWRAIRVLVPLDDVLPPVALVTGFRIDRAYAGGLQLAWDPYEVPDGRTEIRLNGPTWADGIVLYSGNSDSIPWLWPADGPYVLRARRLDPFGRYSASDAEITISVVDGIISGDYLTDPDAGQWRLSDGSLTPWLRTIYDPESGLPIDTEPVEWLVTAVYDTGSPWARNFDARNDRIGTVPAAPTIASDGSAVDHVLKGDASADVSLEWAWAGDEETVDGFEVMVRISTTAGAYTPGAAPASEQVVSVPAFKRAFFVLGISASSYVTFAVRTFRVVDPDIDPTGVMHSAWVQPSESTENPYQPSVNLSFTGDLAGTVGGVPASQATVWNATAVNFDARNDRLATTPVAPTVASDGTAIDHVINTNGSADVSFEWSWGGTEADIDGFELLMRISSSAGAYTFGSDPTAEQVVAVPAGKRAFFVYGVNPSSYITFGVRAYRVVDPDVNAAGILRSATVKSGGSGEDPYRPSASVAFAGDLTGTINGIAATQATVWNAAATNFNSRNDRLATTPVAPTIAGDGSAVDHVINANGSADISFEWSWSGTEAEIDGFQVALRPSSTSSSYTIGSSPALELLLPAAASKRAQFFLGVHPANYYTLGVRAYRVVDPDVAAGGLLYSAWVQPGASGENPYQPAAAAAFAGDVTGTVAGIPAANVNVWSAITGVSVATGQIAALAVNEIASVSDNSVLLIVEQGSVDPDDYVQEELVVVPGAAGTLVVQAPFTYTDGMPAVNDTINSGVFLEVWQDGVELADVQAAIGGSGGSATLVLEADVAATLPVTVRLSASAIFGYEAYSTSRAIVAQLVKR